MKKFWAILLAMMLVLSMVTVAGASEVTEGDTDCYRFYDYGESEGRCGSRIPGIPDFHC